MLLAMLWGYILCEDLYKYIYKYIYIYIHIQYIYIYIYIYIQEGLQKNVHLSVFNLGGNNLSRKGVRALLIDKLHSRGENGNIDLCLVDVGVDVHKPREPFFDWVFELTSDPSKTPTNVKAMRALRVAKVIYIYKYMYIYSTSVKNQISCTYIIYL